MPYEDIIEKHARRVGIDPKWMQRIMHIESGGNSSNRTGSYKGLFQLSDSEFKRHGGTNNPYDPEQNTMAAANKLAAEKLRFEQRTGRSASLKDLYMIHQQGEGGAAAHAANPDRPAWENMLSTGEGRAKGVAWAKKAIWGNVPDNLKAKYGSVENITSKQFTEDVWGAKLEGKGGEVARGGSEYKGKWHRSGESKSEVEARATEPTRGKDTLDFEPIHVDTDVRIGRMVPDIRLPTMPRPV